MHYRSIEPTKPPSIIQQTIKMTKPILELQPCSIPEAVKANLRDAKESSPPVVTTVDTSLLDLTLTWIRMNLKFSKNSIILKYVNDSLKQ